MTGSLERARSAPTAAPADANRKPPADDECIPRTEQHDSQRHWSVSQYSDSRCCDWCGYCARGERDGLGGEGERTKDARYIFVAPASHTFKVRTRNFSTVMKHVSGLMVTHMLRTTAGKRQPEGSVRCFIFIYIFVFIIFNLSRTNATDAL